RPSVRAVESGWSLRSSTGALPIYSTAAYGIRQVSPCPLFAPLLGDKRTQRGHHQIDVNDPKRTIPSRSPNTTYARVSIVIFERSWRDHFFAVSGSTRIPQGTGVERRGSAPLMRAKSGSIRVAAHRTAVYTSCGDRLL